MAKAKKMRPTSLGFVNLGNDSNPKPGTKYPIVDVASDVVGSLKYPQTEFKNVQVRLLNMYIEDLPDFGNKNESLLKLKAHTRTRDNSGTVSGNKEDLSFSLEFNVKDFSPAPGFLQRVVFRNMLVNQFLELETDLVELDKGLIDEYKKVKKIVTDSGLDGVDAINSVPYIKVATKLFDGIISTFGKNADDQVWKEMPSLDFSPGPGGAFLRTGIYVLYESRSAYKEYGLKTRPGKKMPITKLRYKDNEILHESDKKWPISNHLIFMINVSSYSK